MIRFAAYLCLRSKSATPLREVDRIAREEGLDARDRGLLRRMVGTEVRRRGTLRAMAQHFTRGKPKPELLIFLRLGLAQLFFLDRVPAHAAVSETVRAAADALGLAKGRYVNAVLRTAQRARRPGTSGDPTRDLHGRQWHFDEPIFRDREQHPLLWAEDALSMPAPLLKRWAKRLGEDQAFALARLALEEPPLSLRAVGVPREELAAELLASDLATTVAHHPAVLLAEADAAESLFASAAFQEGRVAIQGETALRAAELVAAQQGDRVLELCAAPGGKTAVMAGAGAEVFAFDRSARRLRALPSGLARLGVTTRVHAVSGDGTRALCEAARFDAALVDAPCSNTGVLAQRPGARWRYGPSSQRELATIQARLLGEAARHVRPGGRLVYSTCSLEPEENGQQVRRFLEEHAGWELDTEISAFPAPMADGGPIDGGYAARLIAPVA